MLSSMSRWKHRDPWLLRSWPSPASSRSTPLLCRSWGLPPHCRSHLEDPSESSLWREHLRLLPPLQPDPVWALLLWWGSQSPSPLMSSWDQWAGSSVIEHEAVQLTCGASSKLSRLQSHSACALWWSWCLPCQGTEPVRTTPFTVVWLDLLLPPLAWHVRHSSPHLFEVLLWFCPEGSQKVSGHRLLLRTAPEKWGSHPLVH